MNRGPRGIQVRKVPRVNKALKATPALRANKGQKVIPVLQALMARTMC